MRHAPGAPPWTARSTRPPNRSCEGLAHDLVGEPAHTVLFGLQVGVEAGAVEQPWDNDDVGDPGVELLAIPVDTEPVDAHGLDLERIVVAARLVQQLVEPLLR